MKSNTNFCYWQVIFTKKLTDFCFFVDFFQMIIKKLQNFLILLTYLDKFLYNAKHNG